jgi:hypothetical protein
VWWVGRTKLAKRAEDDLTGENFAWEKLTLIAIGINLKSPLAIAVNIIKDSEYYYYSGLEKCAAACASLVKQSCCCVGFPASL